MDVANSPASVMLKDYLQVVASGRVDWIDGRLVHRLPRTDEQVKLVNRLYQALSRWDINKKFLTVYASAPFALPATEHPDSAEAAFMPDLIGVSTMHLREFKILNPDYRDRLLTVIPRLVVEVPSHQDPPDLRQRRIDLYLAGGIPLVWSIEPELRAVVVYRSGQPAAYLPESEVLTGSPMMPSFELSVASVFS